MQYTQASEHVCNPGNTLVEHIYISPLQYFISNKVQATNEHEAVWTPKRLYYCHVYVGAHMHLITSSTIPT
jgi:hypothetical protein